ncbi:helix-turn-helix domain-containing protein [Candidatus Methanocrinis natronophilus]|uniref:XRE family transcriptional regulator n=1 Tax=Candidatus Methanocrinis natronophilus TaxID=3033396 RepID=A0ABT5X871_9EURY|nr:XRE family transcriptional regulator [Candidatus Methanocrinis natronophilus]MDF0590882.1 XRE family transcriptional regulator [Candidatus Methanocrinis natronophilus]
MTIGERIKQARKIRGMSQRELAERAGVSAQAISKYERDINAPSSGVLLRLSKALGVGVEFFVRPRAVVAITPDYRRRRALPKKKEAAIIAGIADCLERYLEIERILRPDEGGLRFEHPPGFPRSVSSMEEVERAATDLRRAWDLGSGPLDNLVHLLEDRGIKVGVIDLAGGKGFDACTFFAEDDGRAPVVVARSNLTGDRQRGKGFDACTFFAEDDGRAPVVVARSNLTGDRQRFSIAHELGHFMIEPGGGLDAERAASRFAGAFLVPEKAARFELELAEGKGWRRDLSDFELLALKLKYGMSMKAWIYRAKDLGIISEEKATALFKRFRARGWHKREPGGEIPEEWPMRFELLVNLALAEEAISKRRASELLNKPVEQSIAEAAEEDGSRLPKEDGVLRLDQD